MTEECNGEDNRNEWSFKIRKTIPTIIEGMVTGLAIVLIK